MFAVITFFGKLANTTLSHPLFQRRPHTKGSGKHNIIITIPGPLAIHSNTWHAFEGILFLFVLWHSIVLHAECSPTAGGEATQ